MKGYGQFCPLAKAAEIVAERWTPLVLRELMCGSRRFTELKKGVPLMSPSLLSKRLKELEHHGIIERGEDDGEYVLTEAGRQLQPAIVMLGEWGHQWVQQRVEPDDLDAGLLMWDVRRRVDPEALPAGRTVVHFEFMDAPPKQRRWWLVVDRDVDLCLQPPGFDVDVTISASLRTMVEVWLGHQPLTALEATGKRAVIRSMSKWLLRSPFAAG